jgi:HEAT repeat protein
MVDLGRRREATVGTIRILVWTCLFFGVLGCGAEDEGSPAPDSDPTAALADRPVSELVEAMFEDDPARRRAAATVLANRYPEASRAVPVLVDALEDDDESVRQAAREALGSLGRRAAADVATFLEKPDPARPAFGEIADVLAKLGPNVRPRDLCMVLKREEPPATRRAGAAVAALVSLPGGAEPLPDLLVGLLDDPEAVVREMAPAALGLRGLRALGGPMPTPLQEALERRPAIRRLADPWPAPTVTSAAPDAAEARRILEEDLATLRARRSLLDHRRQRELIERMSGLGPAGAEAVPDLRELLDHRDSSTRAAAETILVRLAIHHDDAAEILLGVLQKPVLFANLMAAVRALGKLGPRAAPAVPHLIGYLEGPPDRDFGEVDLALAVARLGANFGTKRQMRRAAVATLEAIGPDARSAAPALRELRSSDDARLRYLSARALRRIGE